MNSGNGSRGKRDGTRRERRVGSFFSSCLAGLLVLAAAAAAAAPRVPEGAHGKSGMDGDEPRVEARLLLHPDDLERADRMRVGVLFDLDPGWHMYWRNPGETGLPTEIRWELEGGAVGPVEWPVPTAYVEADGMFTTFGYEKQVLLPAVAELQTAAAGGRQLRAEVDVLVCESECIPASFELTRALGAQSGTSDDRSVRALFERAADARPVGADEAGLALEIYYSQTAVRPGDDFEAALAVDCMGSGAGCGRLQPGDYAFFPHSLEYLELAPSGVRAHPLSDDGYLVVLGGHASLDSPVTNGRLRGVLTVQGRGGETAVEVDLALPRAAAGTPVASSGADWLAVAEPLSRPSPARAGLGWLGALLLAFAGGVVLNLMPCVLPILAIKVVGLAQLAHEGRRTVLAHGAAYAAGIGSSMLALAGVVIALRGAGTSVGWGFQFQEPLYAVAVSTVLVMFALNLFGVFEITVAGSGRLAEVGSHAVGARRSFFEGLLAVVLATPCSAPFLGTAVGFAFASNGFVIAGIFLTIGLGLAAPYVLVSLVPGWARLIPKAGPWMLHLRAGLGFALLATTVWLLWVVGRSAGVDALAAVTAFLLAVAFAVWVYGMFQMRGGLRARLTGLAVVAVIAVGLVGIDLEAAPHAPAESADGQWQPFEASAVSTQLDSGRPVFVEFTADWCITCKVNERVVIADARVREEFERLDFAMFRADWTLRDDGIRAELARHGKAGVPLYLVYSPGAPERPALLPELLTVETVLAALRDAAPRG